MELMPVVDDFELPIDKVKLFLKEQIEKESGRVVSDVIFLINTVVVGSPIIGTSTIKSVDSVKIIFEKSN